MERRRTRLSQTPRKRLSKKSITSAGVLMSLLPNITANAQSNYQQEFINKIAPAAQELASQNDLYASVMIAQAILESSYGRSQLSREPNYNLFGIKGHYNGQSVNLRTGEDDGSGSWYYINANFRKYPSYKESLQDYVNLLRGSVGNQRYFYQGAWVSQTRSYEDATRFLTGRYATATNYATVLNRIIEQFNLTQYDVKPTRSVPVETVAPPTTNVNAEIYTVVYGDYLWKIATEHGVSVKNLQDWNKLESNWLWVGQQLRVTPPAVTTTRVSESVYDGDTYTVQPGDGLWIISQRTGVSINDLMRINGLTSYLIHPNQILRLRDDVTTVMRQTQLVTQTNETTYTVERGDSLWLIADKYDTTISELKRLNNLHSDLIHPNQVLRVR